MIVTKSLVMGSLVETALVYGSIRIDSLVQSSIGISFMSVRTLIKSNLVG